MSKHSPESDVAFIAALAELLNKNDLTELSVKRDYGPDDSLDVRVVKHSNIVQMAAAAPVVVLRREPSAAAAVHRRLTAVAGSSSVGLREGSSRFGHGSAG